jgi:ADP-ribose pyrophosphatase YjhB (NUDIX family)
VIKEILAFFIKFINPHKPLGTALFNAVARVSISVAFEAVALRKNPINGETEIYLIMRVNDSSFPGQWHVPGSILRPKEDDEHVFARLGNKEFGAKIVKSKFIAIVSFPEEPRGHIISLVYSVELDKEPTGGGKWFPVDKLPTNLVLYHKEYIIPVAINEENFESVSIRISGI